MLPTQRTRPSLFTQLRQSVAVNPLCAEHVGVVDLSKLFRSEGFCRAEDHVPRVVNDDIETAVFLEEGRAGSSYLYSLSSRKSKANSIFCRREPYHFLEHLPECADIVVSDHGSDFFDGMN